MTNDELEDKKPPLFGEGAFFVGRLLKRAVAHA